MVNKNFHLHLQKTKRTKKSKIKGFVHIKNFLKARIIRALF